MRALTLLDVVLIAGLGGIAAVVVAPQFRVEELIDQEDRVVEDLRDLERRLLEHQKTARRDADGDGVGEFAPLTDVLGARAAAARRVGASDVWALDGYLFEVMTPGPRKSPVSAGSSDAVTDYAEVAYLVVAWPERPGETGMRAYAASPQGLLQHQIDGYPYGDAAPAPEWAMVTLDGSRVRRGPAYAGEDWRPPVRALRPSPSGQE